MIVISIKGGEKYHCYPLQCLIKSYWSSKLGKFSSERSSANSAKFRSGNMISYFLLVTLTNMTMNFCNMQSFDNNKPHWLETNSKNIYIFGCPHKAFESTSYREHFVNLRSKLPNVSM